MPKCEKCNKFMGPDFFWENVDHIMEDESLEVDAIKQLKNCQFCREGSDTIVIQGIKFHKEKAVKEYAEYIAQIKDSDNIKEKLRELIVDTQVNKMKNG